VSGIRLVATEEADHARRWRADEPEGMGTNDDTRQQLAEHARLAQPAENVARDDRGREDDEKIEKDGRYGCHSLTFPDAVQKEGACCDRLLQIAVCAAPLA
jgi:hypothetical protein